MKKHAFVILAAVLFCALLSGGSPARAEADNTYGAFDDDGSIHAADAAAMLRGIAAGSLQESARPELDLTRNGEINATDARAVLLYACGGIEDLVAFGERVAGGLCDEALFDRFSYTGTQDDGAGNYKSDTVCVTVSRGRAETSDYTLADIYLQDIMCFQTTFSAGRYRGSSQTVQQMFDATPDAIVAINGDYYTQHYYGPVIRNGTVYLDRVTRSWDIALLLTNGEMVTYPYKTLTKDMLDTLSVYQSWVFGPALLDDEGHAMTRFRSNVQPANPRSVLGYYEPGHYAFLAVDGRSSASEGLTMRELSQLCEDLGFVRAYNLDGGQSSVLLTGSGPANATIRNGRPVSDILAVCDPQQ